MKAKFINKSHISGYLYDHDLQKKETGPNSKNPGTVYITGSVNIATDDALTNVIPVHYTYVTAVTSKGNQDARFGILNDIVEGRLGTVLDRGADGAAKLRIDSSIALNEFYSDRNGTTELVSAKRYEGGFIHIAPNLEENEHDRNTFEADFLITNVYETEADDERQIPAKAHIKGCVFDDYRKSILPVEFTTSNEGAMGYFLGLGASSTQPVFTRVKGQQISETIVRKIEEESAFGAPSVREVRSSRREFIVDWAQGEPYVWDDADSLTAQELTKMMADREIYLADIKRRQDEYQASRGNAIPTAAPASNAQTFNF